MRTKQQTNVLIILVAVFAFVGALLNLLFYAVASVIFGLYLLWSLFVMERAFKRLSVEIHRSVEKKGARRGERVTTELTLVPNMDIKGTLTDVIPAGVGVVAGSNQAHLALKAGERGHLRYTLEMTGRAGLRLDQALFKIENLFFEHTFQFIQEALDLQDLTYDIASDRSTDLASGRTERTFSAASRTDRTFRDAGGSAEFSHVRPYERDPLHRIHWKASARLGRLMAKEFTAELDTTDLKHGTPVSFVIDQSGSMGIGLPGQTGIDLSIDVAQYYLNVAAEGQSPVSLVTYDDTGVVTSIDLGRSAAHLSRIAISLNELEPRQKPSTSRYGKSGILSVDVPYLRKHVAQRTDDDAGKRFKEIVSHLFEHEDGYNAELERAPAFMALATVASQTSQRHAIMLVSDLEGDLDPIIEGIRLARQQGSLVYVIAVFSKALLESDERLLAAEHLYMNYERFRVRLDKIQEIAGVKAIEVLSPHLLQPALEKIKV